MCPQPERKSILNIHWKDWCWSWSSNTLTTWYEEPTHWKRPWCWERLRAGGEGGGREWDGWRASPTRWTWVWASSGRWWRTEEPGVLRSTGLQRSGRDWASEQQIRQRSKLWAQGCLSWRLVPFSLHSIYYPDQSARVWYPMSSVNGPGHLCFRALGMPLCTDTTSDGSLLLWCLILALESCSVSWHSILCDCSQSPLIIPRCSWLKTLPGGSRERGICIPMAASCWCMAETNTVL